MNAQQLPFKLYSRLINNRSQIMISLQDLHIALNEGMPLSATLRVTLPKLGFILNQDYIEAETKQPAHPIISFFVPPETALIYLNTFETTEKVKHCIKAIAFILSSQSVQNAPSLIEQGIKKHQYITQTQEFLKSYFRYNYHYLLPEDDFMELKKIASSCFALRMLLLEVKKSSVTLEEFSDLLASCTDPITNLLNRITTLREEEAEKQLDKIELLSQAII